MKTLIPLSDFVLDLSEKVEEFSTKDSRKTPLFDFIVSYAKFLKQPLTLSMFVPVDNEGNVLIEAPYYADGINKVEEYKKAKEKVFFKDAIVIDDSPYGQTKRILIDLKLNNSSTIRIYNQFNYSNGRVERIFLPNFKENPTVEFLTLWGFELTPSALQQIGIE